MTAPETIGIRPLNIGTVPFSADPGPATADDCPALEELGKQLHRLGIQHEAGTPSHDDLLAVDYFANSFVSAFIDVLQIELLRLQHEGIESMTGASARHTPIDEAPTTAQQAQYRQLAHTLLSNLMPLTETSLLETLALLSPVEVNGLNQPAPRQPAGDESTETEWELVDEYSPAVAYQPYETALEQLYGWSAKALSLMSPSEAVALLQPPFAPQDAAVSASAMAVTPDTKA